MTETGVIQEIISQLSPHLARMNGQVIEIPPELCDVTYMPEVFHPQPLMIAEQPSLDAGIETAPHNVRAGKYLIRAGAIHLIERSEWSAERGLKIWIGSEPLVLSSP